MLYWAIVFLLLGLIAGILGFGGLATTAFGVAEGLVVLKMIGVVLLVVGLIALFNHFGKGTKMLP